MQKLSKEEFEQNRAQHIQEIYERKLFIHPTDTIYGLGCDATSSTAVLHLREAKERYSGPFSVIAPSKDWIRDACEVSEEAEKWLDKLPGPYTLIFYLKKKYAVAPEVNPTQDTIGVRMPDHWFTDVVADLGRPIVTTSANKVGKAFMTDLDKLDPQVGKHLHFAIYEGEKKGTPSTIVNLTEGEEITDRSSQA
jgi:L-threonylcarbamoyladenylate synthase